jgi:hypothetical protein
MNQAMADQHRGEITRAYWYGFLAGAGSVIFWILIIWGAWSWLA